MATSGSRDFNLDVGEVIEEAYERCGLEVRTGYDARTARRSLNLMFAEWANRGLNLWTVKQGTITLTQGQAQETLLDDVVDLLDVVTPQILYLHYLSLKSLLLERRYLGFLLYQ